MYQLNQLLRISNQAIIFLNNYIKPIVTPEYIGWSIPLPKKYKAVLIVDYSEDKNWDLIPANLNKKFRKSTIKKALKFLVNVGWLTNQKEIFEEFAPQLKLDLNNAIIIPKENYITTEAIVDSFPGLSIMYDDDVSGITLQDEDSKDGKQ